MQTSEAIITDQRYFQERSHTMHHIFVGVGLLLYCTEGDTTSEQAGLALGPFRGLQPEMRVDLVSDSFRLVLMYMPLC